MQNAITPQAAPVASGRLADNIVYFARILRKAGVRVGPSAVVTAIKAVNAAGVGDRDDFYWTLHATLITRHEDIAVFDQGFRLFFRSRELVEKMLQMFSPVANPSGQPEPPKAAETRVSQALFPETNRNNAQERPQIEVDAAFTASAKEVLRTKDFAQMTASELVEARVAMGKFVLPDDMITTRRLRAANRAPRIDPRRVMAASLRTGGDLILPRYRQPRKIRPPLVVLADISGSMSQYSRVFLHFMHMLSEKRRGVHIFLFGTRLTNVTRQLRNRDPDQAIAQCALAVEDWSGGTRIGTALHEFNRAWSRRVLAQGATVLLITDGLERDGEAILGHEMDRLHRSCRRLIWLNPLLRFDGFQPRASGIRAMLPHVDVFRAVHCLDAVADLCRVLSGDGGSAITRQPCVREWQRRLHSITAATTQSQEVA